MSACTSLRTAPQALLPSLETLQCHVGRPGRLAGGKHCLGGSVCPSSGPPHRGCSCGIRRAAVDQQLPVGSWVTKLESSPGGRPHPTPSQTQEPGQAIARPWDDSFCRDSWQTPAVFGMETMICNQLAAFIPGWGGRWTPLRHHLRHCAPHGSLSPPPLEQWAVCGFNQVSHTCPHILSLPGFCGPRVALALQGPCRGPGASTWK